MHNGWILDGFPRTVGQARAMHDEGIDPGLQLALILDVFSQRCRCSNGDVMVPDCVILLNRPDEMVIEWCEGRAFDPTTGIIYHPKFNPAPPEIEKFLVRRVDDTPHVIQQRLEQYHETFTEVIELYKVSAACVCARAGDQDCSVWCACVRARALTQHITHHARKVQDRGWVVS